MASMRASALVRFALAKHVGTHQTVSVIGASRHFAEIPAGASTSTPTMADLEKIRILREKGIAPATGRKLADIAAEVWEHNTNPVGPGHRSGLKVLQKPLKGALYASWYPEPDAKNPFNPFKLTPKQERWKEKLKVLRAAGKGPPKKGSGKRSR